MALYNAYRVFMPYCIRRLEDGRYLVLNRDYKPLGVPSSAKVDLETHPAAARINITPALARQMSHDGSDDLHCIYLHKGGGVPEGAALDDYAQRLLAFMRLPVDV